MIRSLLLAGALPLLIATQTAVQPGQEPTPAQLKEDVMLAGTEFLTSGDRESMLAEGEAVYRRVCSRCHDKGISGAPKLGDREAWRVRIPSGVEQLVRHAIEGFQGNQGVHPPRGGDRYLNDSEIEAAVRYMVEQCKEDPELR